MFFTKRKKIESWLKTAAPSPFAELLAMERSGQLAFHLSDLGLTKQEYHTYCMQLLFPSMQKTVTTSADLPQRQFLWTVH